MLNSNPTVKDLMPLLQCTSKKATGNSPLDEFIASQTFVMSLVTGWSFSNFRTFEISVFHVVVVFFFGFDSVELTFKFVTDVH